MSSAAAASNPWGQINLFSSSASKKKKTTTTPQSSLSVPIEHVNRPTKAEEAEAEGPPALNRPATRVPSRRTSSFVSEVSDDSHTKEDILSSMFPTHNTTKHHHQPTTTNPPPSNNTNGDSPDVHPNKHHTISSVEEELSSSLMDPEEEMDVEQGLNNHGRKRALLKNNKGSEAFRSSQISVEITDKVLEEMEKASCASRSQEGSRIKKMIQRINHQVQADMMSGISGGLSGIFTTPKKSCLKTPAAEKEEEERSKVSQQSDGEQSARSWISTTSIR